MKLHPKDIHTRDEWRDAIMEASDTLLSIHHGDEIGPTHLRNFMAAYLNMQDLMGEMLRTEIGAFDYVMEERLVEIAASSRRQSHD